MISGIGTRSALGIQSLVEMRRQLDDLQRQLGTGKKADSYAGVGQDRGLLVGLRNRVAALEGYQSTITNIDVRINLAQTALARLGDIGRAAKAAAAQVNTIESNGATVAQSTAAISLAEMLGLLNTQVGDRYLFSGSAVDRPAVASLEAIMDGDGARAGFKQVVSERRQADLGVDGLGRLEITTPSATSVRIAEDVAGSPFGFKLSGVNSSLANSTVAGPAGLPAAAWVDLSGLPNAGETVQFHLTLPDGTGESITLTATTSAPPGANEFTIGATAAATAGNLQAALGMSLKTLASTSLTAASAVAAGEDFFSGTPQRVAGPPFDSATARVDGTPANTVVWYTGDDGSSPARTTAIARIDTEIAVSYGLRASEEGIRWLVQNVATLAAVTFAPAGPDSPARAAALNSRVQVNLDVPAGTQTVESIQTDLAGAQAALRSAAERHRQTESTLSGMMEEIEGVSTEEVAAKLLALQIRLQASLQTTSMLYQTSLVNYI